MGLAPAGDEARYRRLARLSRGAAKVQAVLDRHGLWHLPDCKRTCVDEPTEICDVLDALHAMLGDPQ
jgi:hypothetical protein